MTEKSFKRIFNLDSIYFFSSIFLLMLIISDHNFLDVLYYFFITFSYIRLKYHRKK